MPARRDILILGGVGLIAAGMGAILGPLLLQTGSGATRLLTATYPDRQGRVRRMLEWQGKVVICNFWATWCEPCREEVPMLIGLHEKYASKGAEVVGISIDQAAKVNHFANSYKVNYALLIADASALDLMRELGNPTGGLPFTVILDRHGAVGYRKLGLLKAPELERALSGLLG